jgi:hypothetical protein
MRQIIDYSDGSVERKNYLVSEANIVWVKLSASLDPKTYVVDRTESDISSFNMTCGQVKVIVTH